MGRVCEMMAAASDESESEEELVTVKRHTPARLLSSESDPEHESVATRSAVSRSSARLRDKASKRFHLPSREEALKQVSPGNTTYTQDNIRSLKPRNLVNNFLRERSTYVTERNYEVDSDDSFLSDFIVDDHENSSSNSDSDQEESGSNVRRAKSSSDDEINNHDRQDIRTRHKRRSKKVRRCAKIASSESDSSDDFNHTEKQMSARKRKRISSGSSESATCKAEDKCDVEQTSKHRHKATCRESATRPRSIRVQKLARRHKNKRHEVLGSFLHKRQSARLTHKERMERKVQEERTDSDHETASELEIWKNYSEDEDEDDRAFVVPDGEVTESEMNSDPAEQVTDILALKAEPCDDGGEKQGRTWHRIVANEESEETSTSKRLADKCSVPVINAVLEGDEQVLEDIVRKDPKCINDLFRKKTALHFAATQGNTEMVKRLLTVGANPTIYDGNHLPAVAYAADGHPECLELILKYTDKSLMKIAKRMEKSKQGFSLLHFAVLGTGDSRVKCLELLFEHDKKTFQRLLDHTDNQQGFTPLVCAVNVAQHKCVQALMARRANPHQFKTSEGGNLLHYAVESASSHMTEEHQDVSLCLRELLPQMKLRIDEVDQNGFTPLMYACESGNADCAAALLEYEASVSTSDSHGTSSLHLAAMIGSARCVQLLLEYGHQVDCLDRHGWPPLLYANFQAHESCVLALMKPKPDQVFVLGKLLRKAESEVDKRKTFKVVKNVLVSLANHDAYYTVFNDFIRAHPEMLDEHNQGLLQDTWRGIVDYDNKRRWFRKKLNQIRGPYAYGDCITLVVDRKNVLGSAMQQLGHVPGHKLRQKSLHVTFKDEPGICTGPKREFYACFCKDVVDTKKGLFTVADDSQYSPLPNAYFAKCTEMETQSSSRACSSEATSQASTSSIQTTSQASTSSSQTTNQASTSSSQTTSQASTSSSQTTSQASTSSSQTTSQATSQTASTSSNSGQPTDACSDDELMAAVTEFESQASDANKRATTPASTLGSPLDKQSDKTGRVLSLRLKLRQMNFIGRMVGFAICEDMLLDFALSEPFVKQVLGIQLSHPADLSSFDNELYKNAVVWVLENSVCELDLPFSIDVVNPWDKKPVTVMLCEEQDSLLSDDNKHMYVNLVSEFMLETSIKDEVAEFTKGLREIIPRELLSFFSADEFSLLINGVCSIDVQDWKRNTQYSGCDADDDIIRWFWSAVSRLKEEEKALLLKFSTGSPCVPVGGFAALQGMAGTGKFTIVKIGGMNKIPLASTCFNMLKLTEYDKEKELREKLLIAIRHGAEGFSFS